METIHERRIDILKSKMNQLFEDQKNVHVLYSYNEMENYIKQVLSYIQDGIMAGDYVILVENDRIYSIIHKELSTRLTKDQMELLHFVNNFDFYCSSGSYHPPAIEEYFNKTVQPYVENKISFRSWAHVEWATLEEPLHIIEEFERTVDKAVNLLSFPLICAYKGERMPEYLKTILLETHPYVLEDDDITICEQYLPSV
ncbi:MEDS domain-containing protein [Peribacillus frigoritolerans]|uniref:MEDS domain-containing protein n=1 Tax=Peribacillus frigoritolerans TaxID=450367 RepID=UPI00207AE8A1|nr:MEDS domain-containing protein [Peribacillus frigoritolerans]USK79894.1 MEDS domain-containing protein [Peribacillus frigoritolerans]WJE47180.1 MEDS domain-containing protein [Peribacillus frigoritolerans]